MWDWMTDEERDRLVLGIYRYALIKTDDPEAEQKVAEMEAAMRAWRARERARGPLTTPSSPP
jgi:hypothetical protein